MSAFVWNDSYSVHVEQFDAQHRKLFEIINDLAAAMRVGQGSEVIRDTVHRLAVYTRTHFLQEEVAMRRTGYPGLAVHQMQHQALMAEVEKFKKDLDEGRQPNTVMVLEFLREWLVNHIQKSDRAYSNHMNAHGVH
ncbi:MAG TPA: bacteriohemerythrin [Acidobacteriaceae bacterium]|nr:bacteriohemerythrin [Acidobacteriaceae bacterium]